MAEVAPTQAKEAKLTRYLVYETTDTGRHLELVAEKMADSAATALRLYFADLPVERAGYFTAVSENAIRIRSRAVKTEVSTTVTDMGSPKLPDQPKETDPEPEPEPPAQSHLSQVPEPEAESETEPAAETFA